MTTLFAHLDAYGSRAAIIGENGAVLTYRDLLAQADAVGRQLGPRPLVLIVCTNTVDCLAGYVGVLRAGGVPLLVHHSMRIEQRAEIAARFRPHHVYAPGPDGRYLLNACGREASSTDELHADLALLLPTSGTTGSRNFVRLSTRNLRENARSIIASLGIGPDDRPITTMPMNYTYGLSILNTHLLVGASMVLTELPIVSATFWELIREGKVTTFGGVPFIYDTLLKLRFGDMQLPNLRYLTQAGGKLARGTTEAFLAIAARKSFRFITMYGQTEATSRIAVLPFDTAAAKVGSIGRAIPGVTIALVDDDGLPIDEAGRAGEIVCRGDNVSLGYASDAADLARGDDNGGVLRTGDVAMRDEDGCYSIVGRKKRFLKVFGHRVNLDEMETLLRRADHDCACAGRDDHIKIFIANGEPARVKTDVTRLTGLHPRSVEVVLVSALCRSESGKIDYARLEAQGA